MTMTSPLLRAQDVADLLAISVWQVDKLRRDGLLPGIAVGSRTWRYHPADIEDFVRRRHG